MALETAHPDMVGHWFPSPVPWKLLAVCVLACVVVYPSAGERNEEETHFHNITTGKSGVVCTRQGRKCVFNATCHNHRCRCPRGQRGQAQIECVNRKEKLCYIAGDPHISAFGKAKATIAMPCRFRATRFVTQNKAALGGHGSCSFEVHATNELIRGRYVVRSVHIAVGISDHALQTHTAADIFKTYNRTVEYDVNDTEIYSYQARVTHRDSIWGTSEGSLKGLDINPTFDDVNNFAVLNVEACGVRIKYRAFDPRRPKHQRQLPGLTIQVPDHAKWYEHGEHPQSLCGTPDNDRSMYTDRAETLGLVNDNTGILYDVLAMSSEQKDNEFARKCFRSFNLFEASSSKVDDVNTCGFILTKPKVARCIEHSFKRLPIDVFNSCMQMRQDASKGCRFYRKAARLCDSVEDWSGPKADDVLCAVSMDLMPTTKPAEPDSFIF